MLSPAAGESGRPATPPPSALVHQDDVDGVPVLWTPSRSPRLTARLRFRLGTVDETPRTRGAAHLLEHCLLSRIGTDDWRGADGEVGPLFTELAVSGSADDVVRRLNLLCRSVAEPFDRTLVAREKALIEAETDHVPTPSAVAAVLDVTRFGFGPYGMQAMRELGLWGLDPDDLSLLAMSHLTRGNAVLELDGDLPAGLRLRLPDGVAVPTPPVPPPPAARTWVSRDVERTAWMSVMEDRPASTALASVVRDELFRRLRVRDAASYAPGAALERLATGHVRLLVDADAVSGRAEAVRDVLLGVLPMLATQAGESELARLADRCREILATATDPLAQINQASTAMLLGRRPRSARARLHEVVQVTVEQLREAAALAWEDLTVFVPRSLPLVRPDIAHHDLGTRPPVEGTPWRIVPAVPDVHGTRLVVARDAVQLRGPDRGRVRRWTVPLAGCSGMLAWPDGRRDLLGLDGTTITVEPLLWRDGHRLVAQLDDLVPARAVAWQPPRPPGSGEPVTVGEPWGLWTAMGLTVLAWIGVVGYAAYWMRKGAWAVIDHLPAELLVVGVAAALGTLVQVHFLLRERRRRRLTPWGVWRRDDDGGATPLG